MRPIILASQSRIRCDLLANAGLEITAYPARIDEDAIKSALLAEGAAVRDIADALAQEKARKLSLKHPEALVIGCDQVLDFDGTLLSKPNTLDEGRAQLTALRGKRHSLLSAAVIAEAGRPIWRHIGQVRLIMRDFSDTYLENYLIRNWDSVQHSVGAYRLEEEGVRLFARIDGDYFTVLGLPLIEILNYLSVRNEIES